MAAPTIEWRQCTGSHASVAYVSIATLDFGTVTAGLWSHFKVVKPKVTVNSIASCKWFMGDVTATFSGSPLDIGTTGNWVHKTIFTDSTCVQCSDTVASAGTGTASPESSGSAMSYNAVAPGAYGDFIVLSLKVASAAGDGATTAWGYQLKYSYT